MANPTGPRMNSIFQIALLLFSLAYLSLGGWLAYQDKVTAATLSVAAALLLLLLTNLDKLEHFKGLGIEAKMRQLDQRISEADDSLKHMRNLSLAMSHLTFETLSRIGRWSSAPSRITSLNIAKELKSHMEAIGLDSDEIESAMMPWHRINIFDMSFPVRSAIIKVLHELQHQCDEELQQYSKPIVADDPKYKSICDRRHTYGEQLEKLEKLWNTDICNFAIHAEEFIQSLEGVSDDAKQALSDETEADRKAAAYYAKHNRFLSESEWLEGQPEHN